VSPLRNFCNLWVKVNRKAQQECAVCLKYTENRDLKVYDVCAKHYKDKNVSK